MADNNDQTMTNPQAMVDAALGGNPPVAPMPPAPDTPPTDSEPVIAQPTPPPAMPVAPPPPVAPSPSVAVGDETPLAFMTPPPSTTTETKTEPMSNLGTSVPMDAIPSVPPALMASDAPTKPKKSKTMFVVLGIFALMTTLVFGGLFAYSQYGTGEGITIAGVKIGNNGPPSEIDNREDCDGESNGGWLVWRNGGCKVTGGSGNENPEKNTENPNLVDEKPYTAGADCGVGYTHCGGDIDKCVSHGALAKAGGGCAKYGEVVYGIPQSTVASFSSIPKAGYNKKCNCYGTDYYFNNTGYCGGGDTTDPGGVNAETLKTGLCSITPSAPSDDGIADWFNNNKATGNIRNTYYCPGMISDTSGGCSMVGPVPNLNCFCGTIQIDTNTGFESKTMKCGCDKEEKTVVESPSPSPSPGAPTMACTGLTRTPTAVPTVGQTVTFTCTGTVTPSSAGTLTYKYRYSLNGGVTVPMTTNTLTIAACGSYKVECQACTTLNGVLTCDPVWTGATQ